MGLLSDCMNNVFIIFIMSLYMVVGIELYYAAQYYVPKYIDEVINPALISFHLEFTRAVESVLDYLIPVFIP
jgi:hypothetical protein